ncbi:MAG: Na/Pi cotransporter family protein [Elusimicrobiota bacterium]|nr:Na/Pi cotransporter family protein [Elusimicrobiota bacterium]
MTVSLFFGVIGGLAVFLYGMLVMNENITRSAGQKLRQFLLSLTGSKIRGYLTGLGITIFNQSSSATTVLEAAFVGAGLMTFTQSLAVTLGAAVGSTITAQLVAFRITKYALLITAAGFFSSFLCKTQKAKSVSGTILGFGLLFLGMDIMSKMLEPLKHYEPFLKIMCTVEKPILGILFGLVFTAIIQSSGATSGITVAMALSGTITLTQAVPINLGASIGTCITAILGSLTLNREAKRTAYIHAVFQTIGVLVVLVFISIPFKESNFWIYFVKWFTKTFAGTDDLPRQIAMAHTLMPLLNTPIILLTLPVVLNLFNKIYPSKEEEKPFGPIYISETLLDTPAIALAQAKKEIARQGEIVYRMLANAIECFNKSERSLALCENVSLLDIKVDKLRNAITEYLRKVSQRNLTEEESKQEIRSLYVVNDFEAIGDVIDKNIIPIARKTVELNLMFSKEGWEEICSLHNCIIKNLSDVLEIFNKNDIVQAEKIALTKPEIGKYESELRMHHIQRLHKGLPESVETSAMHLDLIDQYKRINSHIVSIAYAVMGQL